MKIQKFDELILEAVRKLYLKIKEDTNNSLVYLLDDDYQATCKDDIRYIMVTMSVLVGDAKPFVNIHWSNIKDDFISISLRICFSFELALFLTSPLSSIAEEIASSMSE